MLGPRFALVLACGALAAVPPCRAASEPAPHVIVMRDGKTIPSRTRPLLAFGEVRYTDVSGGLQVHSASRIDATATRDHPANRRDAAQRGTFNVCGSSEPLVPITVMPGAR